MLYNKPVLIYYWSCYHKQNVKPVLQQVPFVCLATSPLLCLSCNKSLCLLLFKMLSYGDWWKAFFYYILFWCSTFNELGRVALICELPSLREIKREKYIGKIYFNFRDIFYYRASSFQILWTVLHPPKVQTKKARILWLSFLTVLFGN